MFAYPANVWMVKRRLKHGLMTQRHHPHVGHHAAAGHGGHDMKSDATRPQLAAVGGVSAIALAIGTAAPANWVNLTLSAHDVGNLIMPPGMIMDRDTPAEAMRDMAAVHPRHVTARHGLDVRGDRELQPRLENGVKVFDLEARVVRWTILPGVTVDAYTFNGQVPGPRLRFRQGERVPINAATSSQRCSRAPSSTTRTTTSTGSRRWACTAR